MIFSRSNLLLVLFVSVASSQSYDNDYQQQEQKQPQRQFEEQQVQQENEGAAGNGVAVDASVPEPPSQIPETSFTCDDKQFDPGMYADQETGCRVYHMCFRGRKEDFICGTGTVFNQALLTCDYQANVNCDESPSFYDVNADFGKGAPEPSGDQKPVARQPSPSRPAARPRPQPAGQQPDYRSTGSAPAPGAQRPYQPPAKANPRPVARPQPAFRPPTQQPPSKARPATRPRPQGKPNVAPRPPPRQPAPQRPVVQEQDDQQSLDYEPSQRVVQRRQLRGDNGSSRRAVAAFRQPSQQWQMMSERY